MAELKAVNEDPLPKKMTAYMMAKCFVEFVSTAHPYPHTLHEIAQKLGAGQNIYLKVMLFERMLHSVDSICPDFYQSALHKQEVKQVIMQTLEDLYDEIEELEEEEMDEEEETFLIATEDDDEEEEDSEEE